MWEPFQFPTKFRSPSEPLRPHQLAALFQARPDLHVFNTYGTTETTGFNTINRLTASNYTDSCETGAVAIGDDVPGWSIHLRGGGTANEGEIVVASDFLSLGYWRDEDRMAELREIGTLRYSSPNLGLEADYNV